MSFHKILTDYGFKKQAKMPKGVIGYSYQGSPNMWCEIYTEKPWPYLWITGKMQKDTRSFPGGRVLESDEQLKEYLS